MQSGGFRETTKSPKVVVEPDDLVTASFAICSKDSDVSQPPTRDTTRFFTSVESTAPVPQPRSKTEDPEGISDRIPPIGHTTERKIARTLERKDQVTQLIPRFCPKTI